MVGDSVDNFDCETQLGPLNFFQYISGKFCLLFSHPADFTPGMMCVHRPARFPVAAHYSVPSLAVACLVVCMVQCVQRYVPRATLPVCSCVACADGATVSVCRSC